MNTDVIIIGGGPAGISCAIWLKKLGVDGVLLEASGLLGGLQTRSPYENLWIPGVQGKTGHAVAASLGQHARDLGIHVRLNSPVVAVSADGREVTTPVGVWRSPYLVMATGTRPRSGGFMASDRVAIGPGTAMEALEVKGRRVALFGGGDNAFDQARFVRDRGGEVTIFTRSPPRAQKLLQDLIPDVPVVVGAYSVDDMIVNGSAFDAFGVMFGFEAVVPEGLTPERENGYVAVDRFGETSLAGVYACGEVTDYWHPCVTTACAHGVQVAKQISMRLGK